MTGNIVCISLLLSLIFLIPVASLRAGGRNVRTSYVRYYVNQWTTTKTVTYSRTCTQTCASHFIFCWSKKTVCRTYPYYKWVYTTKRVARTRPVYSCYSGWRAKGDECTIPICTGGCQNRGVCISPQTCRCTSGWTGSRCRSDVDECRTNRHSCSYKPGCRNTYGSYRCTCRAGYYLMSDQRTCKDRNECTSGQHNCGVNTHCVNIPGSYTCPCNRGFTPDASLSKSCKDINECDPSSGVIHGCQGTCVNIIGSYKCNCSKGHYVASNGRDCTDHDECAGNAHGCSQVCVNYPGGYNCTCQVGYRLDAGDYKSCDDVDECSEKISGCAHKCTNEIGSFNCSCRSGYYLGTDSKSCNDIDECSTGFHHCQHNCVNIPGSYKCNCRPGFDLSPNGGNCAGRPCFPISPVMNGAKNCSGYTTEEVCHFQCSPGYDLIGSKNRTCSPLRTWTGIETKCKIIHCPTPVEPWNGFVYSPCQTHFGSRCTVDCARDYYIQGTQTIICDVNGVWQPRNITCREIKVCQPNPCLHGGICTSLSPTHYSCDCSNTGYKGVTCNVGYITIPYCPPLTVDIPSPPLTFRASPPSDYIVLTFINRDLKFNPVRLRFQHGVSPTKFLRITARQPGWQTIRYSLSGPNAGEFQLPSPSRIFVRSPANSSSDNELLSNTLPFGCHKKQLNKCPHTNDVIYAASTLPWVKFGPLAMTRGVVNVEIGATNVPLSLVGSNLPNSDLLSVSEHCSEEDVSYSAEQFLKSRVLEQSFLDAVRDSLPKWLNITLRNNNSSRRLSNAELKARYLTGKLMRDTDVGEGQPISEDSFYSLLMSRNLNLTIQNDVDLLGSRDNNAPVSLALDLCGPSSKNVILRPSLGDMDLINDIYVTKRLKENGWNFKFYSLQISKKKSIQTLEKVPFWNGERFFEIPSSANGNMAIVSSFSKFFGNTSFVNSGVEFEGTMVVNVDDIDNILDSPLDQEWEVDLYGKVVLTAKFKVEGKTTKLILEAAQSIGYAKFGGRKLKRRSTNSNYDPHGLFFTNILQQDPFVYSELTQFVEMGSNKTISCFLDTTIYSDKENEQSTYSETNNGISMAFHGILKFGPLRFHNLHIQLSMRNANAQETNSSKNTGVEFTANYNELQKRKFGIFEHNLNVPPNIRLHTARNKNSTSTGSFQTVAKILGFEKLVNVSFSYKGMSFPVTGKIHGLFDASMDCNSILASWENQVFVVTGEFEDKSTEGNLRNSLSENMNRFAVEVLRKAQERMASANETEQRAKARLENVLLIEKRALEKVKGIRKAYSTAGRELDLAKKELTYLERVARNYSKDVEELKSELDGLCLVKQCPDICQEGNVCNKCFHDVIGKSMGVCPATCFQTKQRRLPPYSEVLLCDKEKCNRIHSTNGLFKKVFGKLFGGIVKSVLSFGITSVATFFGVPPPISAALGSGLVTLFDTGRIDETLCSIGTGFLTGIIGGPSVTKVFKQYAKVGIKEAVKKSAVSLGRKGAGALVKKVISCQRDQRDGSWKCHVEQVTCTKRVFHYEYEDTPYMCKTSCEKYKITKTVEKTCCSTVPCASFVVNITCVAENALCKKARKIALNQTSATKANAGKILASLESARQNVSYWKIRKQKEYIKLMSASRSLNTSQSAVRSLEKAYNVTVEARKRKLELSAKPLKLKTLMDERLESVVMVKLGQIRFNAKVSAGHENTLLPIDIPFQLNGTREVLSTVLDFKKLNTSLRSIAKEILSHSVGDLSSVSRKKRSVEDIRSSVADPKLSALKDYHRLCSEFTNYEQTLQNVVRSLYNLSSEVHNLRQNLKDKDEATFNTSNVLTRFTLNETMALKFGMNVKNLSYIGYLETDPELFEAKSLIDEAIQGQYGPLELATKLLVYNWFATMENIFNDSAIADECSGLDDCLTSILNGLYEIYAVVDLPGAQKVREHIRDVETKLSNLTQNIDMSVEDAAEISLEILKILENMTEVNDLCARAPNITKHPEVFTEIGVGEMLFLTCNATGGALVYNWRFNDDILQGEASNVLLIKNTTVSHSGNYTCEVSNHIAKEVSTPAVVVVHSPPLIIGQPVDHLSVVLSSDASLQCEIENTDRNISYQWWFKSINSTTFSILINETFSYLNFAPMQAHQEGWYFCNVSNSYGFSVSTTSFVKALHFTLPVPAATLSLYIFRRPDENATFVKKVNTSRYEDISAKISTMLSSFGNSSTNASEVRVVNLHPVNCQLKRSRGNKTDHDFEVCSWKFHYLGENATSNTSVNNDFQTNARKVINATIDIKQAISELLNATNNGSLSFSLDKQTYFVEKNSLTVQDFSLLCSQNQMLMQEDFQCVDCPPGYFGKLDENMIASCFPCSLGSYQPNAAQSSCIKCPEGFTTVYEGSYDKSQCKVICPAGLYGVIIQNIGQCRTCPVNTYQPMEGQFECLSCPSGHVTIEEATVDVAKCILEPTQKVTESHTSEHDTVTTGVVEERTTGTPVPEEVYTSDNGSGNGAWIAGVVVGILVLIIGVIIFFVYRLKKKHGDKYQHDTDDEEKPHRTEISDYRVNPVYSDGQDYKSLGAIAINPMYDSTSDSVSNGKQILDLENLAYVSSEGKEIKTRQKQPLTFGNPLFQQLMLEKNEGQA